MTSVYITRTGPKFHATESCTSFADVEAERGHPIQRWPVDLRGLAQQPCSVCWPITAGYDQWRQLALQVERDGDSDYEVMFVEQVLRQVPGLRASDVALQVKAHGNSGRTYFIDFVLAPVGYNQLAVEVDGDLKSRAKTVDQIREEVDTKRVDLIAAGWRVRNFSAKRVATRSEECVTEIRAAMADAVAPRRSPVREPDRPHAPGPNIQQVAPRGKTSAIALGLLVAGAVVAGGWWILGTRSEDSVPPVAGECPADAPIKGNINQEERRIYHEPGWRYYQLTDAEECFATSQDAEAAGYRQSEVR